MDERKKRYDFFFVSFKNMGFWPTVPYWKQFSFLINFSQQTHANIHQLFKTTSKTQPWNQEVIRALKAFYRTNVIKRQIKYIDAGIMPPKIKIFKAMCVLVRSWDAVSISTVKNCFRKSEILQETQIASIGCHRWSFKLIVSNCLKGRSLTCDHVVYQIKNQLLTMTSIQIFEYVQGKELLQRKCGCRFNQWLC